MNKPLLTLLVPCFISISVLSQPTTPVYFNQAFKNLHDSDIIKLTVKNPSRVTYYYSISLAALTDTGWVVLNSDINSIGQNEFLVLKPLKQKSTAIKYISRKRILFIYNYYKPQKLRFSLLYYKKRDLSSEGAIIQLPPL